MRLRRLLPIRPGQASLAWLILIPIGVVGDALISRRNHGTVNWGMFLGLLATFYGLISAIASIMQPHDPRQMAAFVPLVAAAYVVLGIRGAGASCSSRRHGW
jgi:hypothetical protein